MEDVTEVNDLSADQITKKDLQGALISQQVGCDLFVKPDYDMFDTSVVVEHIIPIGYVRSNYMTMHVNRLAQRIESGGIEVVGSYDSLRDARSAVAQRYGNEDPTR